MDLSASIKHLEAAIETRIEDLANDAEAEVSTVIGEVEKLLSLGKSLHAANGAEAAAAPEAASEATAAPATPAPDAPADPAPAPETVTEPTATNVDPAITEAPPA